ncbi:MAG: DUF3078 domain-containing protein [Bacteroidales bacterium]|nr:DUF3078 domain-containing protein [Bacteroidales bacterium]
MKFFSKIILATAMLLAICTGTATAQDTGATPDSTVVKYWNTSLATQLGFSQVALTAWAAGGHGSISLNGYLDGNANYKRDNIAWNNRLQVGYGFLHNFGEGFKKTDDRIILDSKFGYQIGEKFYFSTLFNFTSQFTTGYKSVKGTEVVSNFLAPAYTSLGFGFDYTPFGDMLSINFAPLTGKLVIVKDDFLRTKYGNREDQAVRPELGAQLRIDSKVVIQGLTIANTLTLFSDYLNKPQNIKVNWDLSITAQLTSFLSATIRTYLIYDDAIKFIEWKDKNGEVVLDPSGNPVMVPGVQFKEISGLSLAYTFGGK